MRLCRRFVRLFSSFLFALSTYLLPSRLLLSWLHQWRRRRRRREKDNRSGLFILPVGCAGNMCRCYCWIICLIGLKYFAVVLAFYRRLSKPSASASPEQEYGDNSRGVVRSACLGCFVFCAFHSFESCLDFRGVINPFASSVRASFNLISAEKLNSAVNLCEQCEHIHTRRYTHRHAHRHTCVHYTTARILQPGQTCQRQSQSHFSRRINVRVCEWATITDSIFTPAEHLPPGTAPGVVSTGVRGDDRMRMLARHLAHMPQVSQRVWQEGTQVRRRSAIIIAIRGLFRQQNRPHKVLFEWFPLMPPVCTTDTYTYSQFYLYIM